MPGRRCGRLPRSDRSRECDPAIPVLGDTASSWNWASTRSPSSAPAGPAQRLAELLEEIELADQVGLDVFGVGEHHRPDFVVSAPAVVLAAAAADARAGSA